MFILDKLDPNTMYTCGTSDLQFSGMIPNLVSTVVTIIKIAIPILLIVYGMMDLGKAVMAQKEDEIKKGQQTFVKRLTAAVIVFLVFFIVQMVLGLVASGDSNITSCMNCFINGNEAKDACFIK